LKKTESYQGISYDKIIDIPKFSKYIDLNIEYKQKFIKLIGIFSTNIMFALNLKSYIKENSSKYEIKYDCNKKEIKGNSQ